MRIPDTKFYIYDVDMDNFMEMEVSKSRVPTECFWDQSDPRLLAVETEFVKDVSGPGKEEESASPTKKPEEQDAAAAQHGSEDFKKKEDDFQGKTLETFFVTTDYKVKR